MSPMRDFQLVNAASLEEAAAALSDPSMSARPYAGGTDLLGALKDRIHRTYPGAVVNLKTIAGLDGISEDEEGLRIGALTTLEDLERHPLVRERYPLLAQAAKAVAAPQLRSMGTVGGNLCQEPRCWYYRSPDNAFDCLRKGGTRCNAFTGESRFHSIFGSVAVGSRPCTAACPGSVDIPDYLALLRAGDADGATRLLLSRNPMPAVTGRVCPHTCESDCNRAGYDEAVSIRAVERFLGDAILDSGSLPATAPDTGRRVAVVGSGPAGLAAAFHSRLLGHAVTVFERSAQLGGLLRHAIPAYRLPARVLDRVLDSYRTLGIEFQTGVEIGRDRSLGDLRDAYDAVFVGPGAWGERRLGLEGEELLDRGLEFLGRVRAGERPPIGRRVLVIGGGNVAVDVALAAKRSGAEEVSMACLESCDEMPAFSHEVERAHEEGIRIVDSCGPQRVLTDDSGRLTGVELARCVCLLDDAGRFAPQLDACDLQQVAADQVILAIGQTVDLGDLGAPELAAAGRLAAEPETGATALGGVFAGGDAVSGPASVIAALAAGRRAAENIDRYMQDGQSGAESPDHLSGTVSSDLPAGLGNVDAAALSAAPLQSFAAGCLEHSASAKPLERHLVERGLESEDAADGLTPKEMQAEADRCFNCGCVAASPSDLAPALIALGAALVTTKRVLPVEDFFAVRSGASTVLDAGELVTEVRVPRPRSGSTGTYVKFRLRNAIDFPILGVACSLVIEEGVMGSPCIVIGAAAPMPKRLHAVEEFLDGKVLTPDVAREAGRLAVDGCLLLPANRYKAQVAAELVRRGLLQLVGHP